MKTIKLLLSGLLLLTPFLGNSQEWDDIYANPDQQTTKIVQKKKPEKKQKIVVIQGNASNVTVEANGRNIDEYNRRSGNQDIETGQANSNEYTDYEYTDRIVKYHDPESSVRITGADEVTIYVGDDLYSDYYENRGYNYNMNMGWGGFYPWYNSWYSPFSYGWNSPWQYGYGYGGFYDPWSYGNRFSPWDGTHHSTVVGTIHGLMVDIMVVDMVDITVAGIIMDITMVITQDLAVADLAEVPLLTELLTVDVQV